MREVYRDTDKVIEADDATGRYRVTWTNPNAEGAILDAIRATASSAHADGEPWVQPTGAHEAYPLAATVTHNGKTWQALTAFCVWEPGVSGWREVVAEG